MYIYPIVLMAMAAYKKNELQMGMRKKIHSDVPNYTIHRNKYYTKAKGLTRRLGKETRDLSEAFLSASPSYRGQNTLK